MREVEDISGYAPADGLLADMLSTDGPARREALAKEAVSVIGRAIAEGRPIASRNAIVVAATRSGVPWRASFAAELYDLEAETMRRHQAHLSAQAIARAKEDIDYCRTTSSGNFDALEHCLENVVETGLDRLSDEDREAAIPTLVAYAAGEGEGAESLIRHLQMLGRIGRRNREAMSQSAHQAGFADRAARRQERKRARLSSFATYPINTRTGRAVADEEFEAAEIARAEHEIVEAATQSGVGLIAEAKSRGADIGMILVEVFVASCRTRSCPIDVGSMVVAFAEAAGDASLAGIFERTIAAARACASPADTEKAFSRLLCDVGIPAPFSFAPDGPAKPAEALVEIEAPLAPAEGPAAPEATPDDEVAGVAPTDLRPRPLSELTRPPGLVGEIIDWIEKSAPFPSRELALGAALGWVAALAGRGFETPSQARTNLMIVCLALSGVGKDHAPSCINSLAQATGLDRFLGPARFMSSSGLRNEIMAQPTMLAIQDEYGGILRQIDGPKVGIHNEMIRYDLLGLFSRAKDNYAGAAYASARAVKIYNPNLCILGLSTPDDFWSALSSSRSQDGFLGRYILINVETPKPARMKPTMSVRAPPQALIDGCNAIRHAVYRGNVSEMKDGSSPFAAEVVDVARGAEQVLEALEAKIGLAAERADFKVAPFWSRAYEHALKLALTVAIGVDPVRPIITAEVMQWAADLAWTSVCALCREAENRMADNDRQRSFNRVIEIVRRTGPAGLPLGKLVDKLGGTLDKRLRTELIEEAEQTGRIASILFKPTTGRPGCRFVAAEFRPDMAG